jgi:predicted dehydrogenase
MIVKRKIKVGVVGCGVVATAYYLPYILKMETVELVSVCDIYPERTAACVRLFGAREEYLDYYEMIEKSDIEAVLILTGPGTHVPFTLKALEKGIHVLLQKPMALNLEDARTIARVTREKGLVVLVEPSSNSLLDPDIVLLRGLIDNGVLGKPYWFSFFESRPERPHPSLGGNPYGMGAFYSEDSGGVLFDFPYAPALIVSLLGPCKSVTGLAKLSVPERYIVPEEGYNRYLQQATDPFNSNYWDEVVEMPRSQEIKMAAPDNVFSLYEMENGFTGVFHVGRPFQPTLPGTGAGGLMVFGSEGNLVGSSILTARKELLPEVGPDGWWHLPSKVDWSKAKWPQPVPGSFNYYHESTQHFIDCILEGRDPLPNVEFGMHITEMMWGALESSRSGKRYEITATLQS